MSFFTDDEKILFLYFLDFFFHRIYRHYVIESFKNNFALSTRDACIDNFSLYLKQYADKLKYTLRSEGVESEIANIVHELTSNGILPGLEGYYDFSKNENIRISLSEIPSEDILKIKNTVDNLLYLSYKFFTELNSIYFKKLELKFLNELFYFDKSELKELESLAEPWSLDGINSYLTINYLYAPIISPFILYTILFRKIHDFLIKIGDINLLSLLKQEQKDIQRMDNQIETLFNFYKIIDKILALKILSYLHEKICISEDIYFLFYISFREGDSLFERFDRYFMLDNTFAQILNLFSWLLNQKDEIFIVLMRFLKILHEKINNNELRNLEEIFVQLKSNTYYYYIISESSVYGLLNEARPSDEVVFQKISILKNELRDLWDYIGVGFADKVIVDKESKNLIEQGNVNQKGLISLKEYTNVFMVNKILVNRFELIQEIILYLKYRALLPERICSKKIYTTHNINYDIGLIIFPDENSDDNIEIKKQHIGDIDAITLAIENNNTDDSRNDKLILIDFYVPSIELKNIEDYKGFREKMEKIQKHSRLLSSCLCENSNLDIYSFVITPSNLRSKVKEIIELLKN